MNTSTKSTKKESSPQRTPSTVSLQPTLSPHLHSPLIHRVPKPDSDNPEGMTGQSIQRALYTPQSLTRHDVNHLQSTVGNRAVIQLLRHAQDKQKRDIEKPDIQRSPSSGVMKAIYEPIKIPERTNMDVSSIQRSTFTPYTRHRDIGRPKISRYSHTAYTAIDHNGVTPPTQKQQPQQQQSTPMQGHISRTTTPLPVNTPQPIPQQQPHTGNVIQRGWRDGLKSFGKGAGKVLGSTLLGPLWSGGKAAKQKYDKKDHWYGHGYHKYSHKTGEQLKDPYGGPNLARFAKVLQYISIAAGDLMRWGGSIALVSGSIALIPGMQGALAFATPAAAIAGIGAAITVGFRSILQAWTSERTNYLYSLMKDKRSRGETVSQEEMQAYKNAHDEHSYNRYQYSLNAVATFLALLTGMSAEAAGGAPNVDSAFKETVGLSKAGVNNVEVISAGVGATGAQVLDVVNPALLAELKLNKPDFDRRQSTITMDDKERQHSFTLGQIDNSPTDVLTFDTLPAPPKGNTLYSGSMLVLNPLKLVVRACKAIVNICRAIHNSYRGTETHQELRGNKPSTHKDSQEGWGHKSWRHFRNFFRGKSKQLKPDDTVGDGDDGGLHKFARGFMNLFRSRTEQLDSDGKTYTNNSWYAGRARTGLKGLGALASGIVGGVVGSVSGALGGLAGGVRNGATGGWNLIDSPDNSTPLPQTDSPKEWITTRGRRAWDNIWRYTVKGIAGFSGGVLGLIGGTIGGAITGLVMGAYKGGKAGLGGPRAGQIVAEGTWNLITKKTPWLRDIPVVREVLGAALGLTMGTISMGMQPAVGGITAGIGVGKGAFESDNIYNLPKSASKMVEGADALYNPKAWLASVMANAQTNETKTQAFMKELISVTELMKKYGI